MEDLKWCIDYLMAYNKIYDYQVIYDFNTFRALLNITMPNDIDPEFYDREQRILQAQLRNKKITDASSFPEGISLYQGDITLIKADVVVNACNSKMLGCFVPGHHCIDNAIHSFGGLEVRRDMMVIMEEQGCDEENGQCKVTKGYHLPSKYIFHTVGPIYSGIKQDEIDLANCYYSCLRKANMMNLESIVFSSLSTGIFGFPLEKASRIAVKCVKEYMQNENKTLKRIIFDCFTTKQYEIYQKNLEEYSK